MNTSNTVEVESQAARCPVHASVAPSHPQNSESLFVEHAAKDLIGSEQYVGDPAADALLADTRAHIYYWPKTFTGFCGRLVVREGGQEWRGGIHVRTSRSYTVQLEGYPELKWLKYQIEELVAHREQTSVSHIASKGGVTFGDNDAVYGQRIDFVGDKMQSFYRLKDHKMTQIGRGYGKMRFIINIDEHADCGGFFAASHYTAFYTDIATGRFAKAETYLDRYQLVHGHYLPVERRFSEATDAGLRTRQVLFEELHVLS